MKYEQSKTNYLSQSSKSEYDNLERRVFFLSQQWLDHTACLKKNQCVDKLCEFITHRNFSHFSNDAQSSGISQQDYYFGQIIEIFILLNTENMASNLEKKQSNEREILKEKRRELDKILDEYYRLTLELNGNTIDFNRLNEQNHSNSQSTDQSPEDVSSKENAPSFIQKIISKIF